MRNALFCQEWLPADEQDLSCSAITIPASCTAISTFHANNIYIDTSFIYSENKPAAVARSLKSSKAEAEGNTQA